MKNTKSKTTWFNSRKYGKSVTTAIRNPSKALEPKIEVNTDKKLAPNMLMAKRVLEENGKISLEDAVTELLKIHTLRTSNPIPQARKIFLHASKYRLPVKITVENKVKYVELA